MAFRFRDIAPKRTCTIKRTRYSDYKPDLIKDFNHHCGYTHVKDALFGGSRTFQIDHIKPRTKYQELENDYNNLVYCCSYVNRAKWDDDSPNYLNPCSVDYNEHFERDHDGRIVAKTDEAQYMLKKMHLDLTRYALAWYVEQLENLINRVRPLASTDRSWNDIMLAMYDIHWDYSQALQQNL